MKSPDNARSAHGSLNKAFVLNSETSLFIAMQSFSECEKQRSSNKSNKSSQSIMSVSESV